MVELASIPPTAAVNEAHPFAVEAVKEAAVAAEMVEKGTFDSIGKLQVSATEVLSDDVVIVASELIIGFSDMHRTVLSASQRMFHTAVEMATQFAACTSFTDLAQTHRAVLRRGFDEWLTISQELLMANRRITDRAIHAWELR